MFHLDFDDYKKLLFKCIQDGSSAELIKKYPQYSLAFSDQLTKEQLIYCIKKCPSTAFNNKEVRTVIKKQLTELIPFLVENVPDKCLIYLDNKLTPEQFNSCIDTCPHTAVRSSKYIKRMTFKQLKSVIQKLLDERWDSGGTEVKHQRIEISRNALERLMKGEENDEKDD